ncbi:hypothetical protein [Streptomyces venezuelae]|uniref:hypothetical protein n=1 Tax=Streptomyces venezuelae TaxID=54571 RepID=UPI00398A03E5
MRLYAGLHLLLAHISLRDPVPATRSVDTDRAITERRGRRWTALGALWRYRRDGALRGALARRLVARTLPGVIACAAVRVFALPGSDAFRVLATAFLLPLGAWLCLRTLRPTGGGRAPPKRQHALSPPLSP